MQDSVSIKYGYVVGNNGYFKFFGIKDKIGTYRIWTPSGGKSKGNGWHRLMPAMIVNSETECEKTPYFTNIYEAYEYMKENLYSLVQILE